MKKLKLNLEDLKVESFETVSRKNKKGTINGNAPTWPNDPTCAEECITAFTDPCDTQYNTCDESCGVSCPATCAGSCVGPTCKNTCQNTCQGVTCDFPCP